MSQPDIEREAYHRELRDARTSLKRSLDDISILVGYMTSAFESSGNVRRSDMHRLMASVEDVLTSSSTVRAMELVKPHTADTE